MGNAVKPLGCIRSNEEDRVGKRKRSRGKKPFKGAKKGQELPSKGAKVQPELVMNYRAGSVAYYAKIETEFSPESGEEPVSRCSHPPSSESEVRPYSNQVWLETRKDSSNSSSSSSSLVVMSRPSCSPDPHAEFSHPSPEAEKDIVCPSVIHIVGDYSEINQMFRRIARDLLSKCEMEKDIPSVEISSRKEIKQITGGADTACVICIPVLERYIIDDPEDPSTGFTREIDSLENDSRVIIVVSYKDDVPKGRNFHPSLSCLWNEKSRQQRLKKFADCNQFFSIGEGSRGLKKWQKKAMADVLGLKLKGGSSGKVSDKKSQSCIIS